MKILTPPKISITCILCMPSLVVGHESPDYCIQDFVNCQVKPETGAVQPDDHPVYARIDLMISTVLVLSLYLCIHFYFIFK